MENVFMLSCVNLLLGLSLRTPQQRPNACIFGPSDSNMHCCARHHRPLPPELQVSSSARLISEAQIAEFWSYSFGSLDSAPTTVLQHDSTHHILLYGALD